MGFGLGKSYNYVNNIKTPDELGISKSGDQIAENIGRMFQYVNLLSDGASKASKDPSRGGLMGNKQFIPTMSKCMDVKTCVSGNDMAMYVNDVPSGKFTPGMKGLVPGIIEDSVGIIPNFDTDALLGGEPKCACVRLPVKINNSVDPTDISNTTINPHKSGYKDGSGQNCWYISKSQLDQLYDLRKISLADYDKYNKIFSKSTCRESFTNMTTNDATLVNTTNIYASVLLISFMYLIIQAIKK